MSTYPTSPRNAFLDWCRVHEPIFTAHAAAVGLTPAQAATFKAKTDAARDQLLAHETIKQAAKTATQDTTVSFNQLRSAAGEVVRSIRAFAVASGDPQAVYSLAQIPPPAPPTPQPPPARPSDLSVSLDPADGSLTLRWKATNPKGAGGTSYIIRRMLPDETEFRFIGASGKKKFVDDTLIAGPDSVQYTVQGQRGDQTGPVSPVFIVNFGRLPGGRRTVTGVSARTADDAAWNVELPPPSNHGRAGVTRRPPTRAGQ